MKKLIQFIIHICTAGSIIFGVLSCMSFLGDKDIDLFARYVLDATLGIAGVYWASQFVSKAFTLSKPLKKELKSIE